MVAARRYPSREGSEKHQVYGLRGQALLRRRVFRACRDGSVVADCRRTQGAEVAANVCELLRRGLLVLRNLQIIRN